MNNVTEKALSTDHTGYFYVMNCSLQELKSVTVTHSTDYPHEMRHITADYSKMKNMSTSKQGYPFPYEAGFLSHFDYWTVEVETASGYKYKTNDYFLCNLTYDDDGFVYMAILPDLSVHTMFSYSTGCVSHLINKF
ncbi:TPA: hypothetical protein ACJTPC_001885 [Providencia alcalifaciens]|uniref:hypothetical protein n=1 Tax=Providencia alcalifaciens TaxID=126385 RepID=UPI00056B6855|nr:hypothetical protein [Providencia alcalifaciens]